MQSRFENAVLVALGSNLKGEYASSIELLEAVLDQFAGAGFEIFARSSWWRSAAWPNPGQPDYINGLVAVETMRAPDEILVELHRMEARFGRSRGPANAARTADLDLIAYGRMIRSATPPLLPHPRAAERLFVMGPLAEIAPDWRHPATGETARDLAAKASVGRDAAPV